MKPLNAHEKLIIAALAVVNALVWGAVIYEVATW